MDDFVADVSGVIERRFGDRRTVLVGESFGGTIALGIASKPPTNLAAVVAVDPIFSTKKLWSIAPGI